MADIETLELCREFIEALPPEFSHVLVSSDIEGARTIGKDYVLQQIEEHYHD